jgi:hypothetical protein
MTPQEAQREIDHFMAEVGRFASCLIDGDLEPDVLGYARALVVAAVERRHDMRSLMVESESAGRQSVTRRPVASPGYTSERFTSAEIDKLAGLCSQVSGPAVPVGRFPKGPRWPWKWRGPV